MISIENTNRNFPRQLLALSDPPSVLNLSEQWDFSLQTISVVGARSMRPWVSQWLESEFLPILKKYKIAVISGGARGVDQEAHRMALRAHCPTLAFLPSGLDCIYPQKLVAFKRHSQFVMATEYENNKTMRKHHFFFRNRLIAAMSPILFVVQAQKKSGSMMTARLALEYGRTVVTLPGHVLDPEFSGNNQLLYDGAMMIRNMMDFETLLQTYGWSVLSDSKNL